MDNQDRRKLLSALCHGAIFFSSTIVSIGIPIAILLITDDPVVKENAKESINFHINLFLYAILFGLLVLVAIGIPLLVLLGIASILLPIIAIVRVATEPQTPYRYPLILRLL
ncbi:MAG: DUF4870 domain-containing protein [Lyngbya sp. HA4199-MV5]|jgi:hypothetical protein|nr:DUF4870 domain-containing protein [Lyngbya sp. HA4199-MV5]